MLGNQIGQHRRVNSVITQPLWSGKFWFLLRSEVSSLFDDVLRKYHAIIGQMLEKIEGSFSRRDYFWSKWMHARCTSKPSPSAKWSLFYETWVIWSTASLTCYPIPRSVSSSLPCCHWLPPDVRGLQALSDVLTGERRVAIIFTPMKISNWYLKKDSICSFVSLRHWV